jgi:cytochrome c oxidase subunit 4
MYLAAAARLARQRAPTSLRRSIATTVSPHSSPAAAAYPSPGSAAVTPVAISNVEASWTKLSPEERASVHQQLETVQQKDWKELSVDEKKAGE